MVRSPCPSALDGEPALESAARDAVAALIAGAAEPGRDVIGVDRGMRRGAGADEVALDDDAAPPQQVLGIDRPDPDPVGVAAGDVFRVFRITDRLHGRLDLAPAARLVFAQLGDAEQLD